jgi:hypothetical protein
MRRQVRGEGQHPLTDWTGKSVVVGVHSTIVVLQYCGFTEIEEFLPNFIGFQYQRDLKFGKEPVCFGCHNTCEGWTDHSEINLVTLQK